VNISGTVDVQGNKIIGVQDPTNSQDAATKNYVDTQVVASSSFTVVGDDSTGTVFNTGETIRFQGQGTTGVTVTDDTVFISSTASIPPLTFVGDDSTGTSVNLGETFKIAGTSNITTAVSGDTLTITGPNLSSYLTNSTIIVVGDDSTGVTLNSNETIKIAGTQNITTAVSGDTLTITGPNLTNYAQKSDTAITLVSDDSTGTAVTFGETFKIAGAQNITTAVSGDTLTITGPNLSAYLTNSPITVVGDDSTGVTLNSNETIKIAGTQNITTAVSGDTLTITGPDLSSYITNSTITIVGDDSTGVTLSSNETIKIAGTNNITTAVSGDTLTITGSTNINVNEISSSDSSAIQINDAVNVSGILTAGTMVTNDISSGDSTAIQINDSVNISGNLSVDSMDVNSLTSSDSSQLIVTDNFRVDGYLHANQLVGDIILLGSQASPVSGAQTVNFNNGTFADIFVNNDTTVNFTGGTPGTEKTIFVHNTAGSNKNFTFERNGVSVGVETINAGQTNVYQTWILDGIDYITLIGTTI